MPENCISRNIVLDKNKFRNPDKYTIIVIGALTARKAVGIFLQALAKVRQRDLLHVDIVGDGPMKSELQKYAQNQNLDNLITWHGKLPRAEAIKVFNSAHLHVITSVSEGNPTTIWEAMSYGVPTMSFDHCGMHDTICEKCGIKIPISKQYKDCVAAVTHNIDELLEHPERFRELAQGTIECAQHFTWAEREKILNNLYASLLLKKTPH